MDLEQLEALALSDDRSAALAGLLPGTVEHDYWRGVHLQHRGQLADVDAILGDWQRRHGHTDVHHQRLARRQLLLRAGHDLPAHADTIRFEAGLRLDDQAEAVAAAQRYPTRLDPAILAEPRLVRDAIDRGHDLAYLGDWALPDLVPAKLDATRRRHLLQRLPRANLPGVVALIAADLGERSSRGFGTLPIHGRLSLAQLDELAALAPELRHSSAWVHAVLQRMRPPIHVDWHSDLAAREQYLADLWRFVAPLAPSFNGLRALVLHEQLDLGRRRGRLDRARFLAYLALPRLTAYGRTDRLQHVPTEHHATPDARAAQAAGLTVVADDEPLVRAYLEHLLVTEDDAAFAEYLDRDWLTELLAGARLLAGAPEPERWAALLGPARLAALRERVDLELAVDNPTQVAADAEVFLELDLKNVGQLVIKTFRVDPVAYFLARRAEVDTAIDLDGMVASDEQVLRPGLPAIRRVRQRIALPACARPGTYVIDLIGNGKASRALIRKGGLRHSLRIGAAGPTVRVQDEHGDPLPDARLWLGGREYTPRADGAISIPFSTAPARTPMLLVHGDIAQQETLQHPAETYHFSAGLHLEREALIPGKTARALVRPLLSLAGWPAPVALIDDPRVDITIVDRAGTSSTKTQSVQLHDDAETLVELQVPEDAASITVAVRGQLRVASTQQTLDLVDQVSAAIGLIHQSDATCALHLAATEGGHVVHLLGKSGEPRGARAVAFTFKHVAVTFDVVTTLETDEHGRVHLGDLAGVERVTASLPSGVQHSWSLTPELAIPRVLHLVAGAPITLPRPPWGAPSLALSELRGGAIARDHSDLVRSDDRTLTIAGTLPPGEHLLQCRGLSDLRLVVAPHDVVVADGWASAGPLALELSPPLPVLQHLHADAERLLLRVAQAGPQTRVHLIATRFRPDRALPRTLQRTPRAPLTLSVPPVRSHFVSGRDIGDEVRYVLERRGQPRRPGVLLDKPGLLLNPWALRTTSSSVQLARSGGAFAPSPARAPAPAAPPPPPARPEPALDLAAYTSLDFLPSAAVVLANLRLDERGELTIPRAQLGAAQHLRVLIVDPTHSSSADLPLPASELRPRDLRLRLALAHDGHFSEERRVEGVAAGTTLVVEDLRSGKLELVDTIARAHQVLLALGAPDTLREFSFLTHWHTLDETTRRARYSKYACHELHLFLYFRDREFFDRVVAPYLPHKRHKTFLDRWLLAEDLSAYRDPWAFHRLNALEQVLLARRHPALAPAIARLLGDAVDLVPPDPERDARLVDTLLGATALEGGGVAAEASAAFAVMSLDESSDDDGEQARRPAAPKLRKREAREESEESDQLSTLATVVGRSAATRSPAAPGGAPQGFGGGGLDRDTVAADMLERRQAAPLFRAADKTQEWAESDWWHVRSADAGPHLIAINRFWRDLARHDGTTAFLSPQLGECTDSLAAALCALAVQGLPFVAGAHAVVVDEARLTLTCASPALAARTRITATAEPAARAQILVGQSYFRADDRWVWDGAEQVEKYADGELLTGVVYQCQVVITNPTSRTRKLAVLLQIPRGAVPVASGFYTRTQHLHLHAHGTHALEYAFYFPAPGQWPHFPAHVSHVNASDGTSELLACAAPTVLDVVVSPSRVDDTAWAHVSQHGSTDEVLAYLARHNLGRVDLERIAWRMRDPDAFTRVLALLESRHTYSDRLWAYALVHHDRDRVAQWLRHQDEYLRPAGPALERAIVDLDPIDRRWYEHLEYAPLINARAHQLGERRQILNDALAAQYRGFLEQLAHRHKPGPDGLLAAAHYLLCLDRIDDALAALDRVDPDALATRLQYDYLAAYAACCRGDLPRARALATPWLTHPVDRWRHRFVALVAMLDEAQGSAAAAARDPDSRDQRMDELAARQPALALSVEHGAVVLQHHNLAACQLRFYRMDIELLFSRQPLVQGDVERFSWIDPGALQAVPLSADGRTTVAIPDSMRGANLVIAAVADGLRRSITHYAHDLATQLAQQYGQLRVLRASTQAPLPATYVKVYARQQGGAVRFYKDGYTDLRGRFDYVTLSTDDLDRVERFAILVASDDAGATVLEADPPPR